MARIDVFEGGAATVGRPINGVSTKASAGAWTCVAPMLCLRLQRGCGVRGWGRDGLETGARGRGARARRALMLPSLLSSG